MDLGGVVRRYLCQWSEASGLMHADRRLDKALGVLSEWVAGEIPNRRSARLKIE